MHVLTVPVWEVAYNTCATLEENDDFINGGAICKNLTASALTYISEHQVIKRPQPVTCVVSVGDGIWPSSPFTKSDNFHVCAAVRDLLAILCSAVLLYKV